MQGYTIWRIQILKYNLFLENTEGKIHRKAKMKLFDSILQGNIKIIDTYDNTYNIFQGEYDTEFLHIESFLIKPNKNGIYVNSAMLSNNELPCIKYLNFNKDEHRLLCNQQGYYGAIENLPCRKCIEINLGDKQEYKYYVGYTPDIAFGYNGEHKIWLEINYTHPCSDHKINYCINNNIILLEINADDVLKCNTGELYFNNYNLNYFTEKNRIFNETINIYLNEIKDIYCLSRKVKDLFMDFYSFYYFKDEYLKFLEEHNFKEYVKYNNFIKSYLCIEESGFPHLIVTDELYNELLEVEKQEYKIKEYKLTLLENRILQDMNKNGCVLSNKYKKEYDKLSNNKQWTKFLNINNLKEINHYGMEMKEKLEIHSKGYPFIIVKNDCKGGE